MEKWKALLFWQKLLAVAVLAALLLGGFFYLFPVRCAAVGSVITCAWDKASETPETEQKSNPEVGTTNTEVSAPLSESSTRPEPISANGDAVVVNDQLAGPIVEVTMLTFSRPGWVAVYEDRNGEPGNVLGAARFEEGIHLGEISLLRSTEPAHTYYLILHGDTDNKEFDLKKNPVLIDANGSPIRAVFHTLGE